MDSKRILLVEDNPNDVELTMSALEQHHLANEVAVTRDGAEALDFLHARGRYDGRQGELPVLVLLDLKMPKMDGIEVLRAIKAEPGFLGIPIVILTSSKEERDVVESYHLGVNAYVVKPVDFDQFVDVVKQVGLFWVLINHCPRKHLRSGK
jgi:CheY-like chemotaxis protein